MMKKKIFIAFSILFALALFASAKVIEVPDATAFIFISGKPPSAGGGSVAYDSSATSAQTSGTSTSITDFTLTIGSITNGAVVVGIGFRCAVPSGLSVTVGGSAASLISGTSYSEATYAGSVMYGLATGSATGDKTISISWTGACAAGAYAISFSGVNQTTPFENGTGTSYAYGVTSASINITSATNDMTVDSVVNRSNTLVSSPSQTQRVNWNPNTNGLSMGGSTAAGSSSNTHSWTIDGQRGAHSGVSVNAN